MLEIDSPDEAELFTQLIRAAENGQVEVVESLINLALKAGCDVNKAQHVSWQGRLHAKFVFCKFLQALAFQIIVRCFCLFPFLPPSSSLSLLPDSPSIFTLSLFFSSLSESDVVFETGLSV